MHPLFRGFVHHFIPAKENAYRPHLLRRGWLLVFLSLIVATEGFLVVDLLGRQAGLPLFAAVVPSEIVALTNTERGAYGMHALVEDPLLHRAAEAKARDMASKGYFSHVSPSGVEPWTWISGVGYTYAHAGENLAVRFVDSKDVVEAWMESPGHRANITKAEYTDIGVGIASGMYEGQPAVYVVQYFAAPDSSGVSDVTSEAHVAAAATSVTPVSFAKSLMQSLERELVRIVSEPRSSAQMMLGGIVFLLALSLLIAIVIHIEIQPTHMLASGAMVAVFALCLMAINAQFLTPTSLAHPQAASVMNAFGAMQGDTGVVIGDALSVER